MKKILIYLLIGIGVLLIINIFSGVFFKQEKNNSSSPTPQSILEYSPVPKPIHTLAPGEKPRIISVSPTDGDTNVSLNTTITVIFDREVSKNAFIFWWGPNVTYKTSFDGKKFTASTIKGLNSGSLYSFQIKFVDDTVSKNYSFTTTGNGPITTPGYDPVSDTADSQDKQFYPDVYIANRTPYGADGFTINAEHVDSSPYGNRFKFAVLITNTHGQANFYSWVKSLGITDAQINNLQIEFTNPSGKSN